MILYTTKTCPQCRFLKEQLREAGLRFDIVNDPEALEKAGIASVPVLETEDGRRMNMRQALAWIKEAVAHDGTRL